MTFRRIAEAWEILSDPKLRAAHAQAVVQRSAKVGSAVSTVRRSHTPAAVAVEGLGFTVSLPNTVFLPYTFVIGVSIFFGYCLSAAIFSNLGIRQLSIAAGATLAVVALGEFLARLSLKTRRRNP